MSSDKFDPLLFRSIIPYQLNFSEKRENGLTSSDGTAMRRDATRRGPSRPVPKRSAKSRTRLQRNTEHARACHDRTNGPIIVRKLQPCFISAFRVNRSDRCESHTLSAPYRSRERMSSIAFDQRDCNGRTLYSRLKTKRIVNKFSPHRYYLAYLSIRKKYSTVSSTYVKPMLLLCHDYHIYWRARSVNIR